MLSHSCQYALRSVIYIAEKASEKNKFRGKDISKHLQIPTPFLSKILKELSRNGLVTSTKGPGGGFYLTNLQKEIKIIDVLTCTEEMDKFNRCFLGLSTCSDQNPCSMHSIVVQYRKQLTDYLSTKSIQDLANESAEGISHLV